MGYCITLVDTKFKIKAENKTNALKAIIRLAALRLRYAWVDSDEFKNAASLSEALTAWRYEARFDVEDDACIGDVVDIAFEGEKMGDDKVLFDAIAPFVADGSYLQFAGEDGNSWRWVFQDGKCTEKTPRWD